METNENYRVSQGAALTIDVVLRDALGDPATSYDGTQGLVTTVWPGGNRAAVFLASTMWVDPAAGAIAIAITGTETASLAPGRYQVLTRLDDAGTPVDAYGCTLDVIAS